MVKRICLLNLCKGPRKITVGVEKTTYIAAEMLEMFNVSQSLRGVSPDPRRARTSRA